MVFHKMPYFLQLFAKNLVKTPKHGSLHEKLLVLARSTRFALWPVLAIFESLSFLEYLVFFSSRFLHKTTLRCL